MRNSIKRGVVRFWRNRAGATAIEYALIAALIAVVIIGALMLVNGSMTNLYDRIRGAIVPAIENSQGAS